MSQQPTDKSVAEYKYLVADTFVAIISSWIQLFVGYPLDYIKTRMQMYPNDHPNTYQYVRVIIRDESISTLYKGISSPLTSAVFSYSLYYVAYEWARRQFCVFNNQDVSQFIPGYQIFLAGAFGVLSIVIHIRVPLVMSLIFLQRCITQIKLKKQRTLDTNRPQTGPLKLLIKTIKENGIRRVYKGSSVMLVRDFLGCGTFFTVHQYTLMQYTPVGKTRHDVSQIGMLIAGLAAGTSSWLFSYPLDVVKTRMQGDNINNPRHKSSSGYFKEIYYQGGIKQFYKGLPITTLRSMIVSVLSLYVYENLHKASYVYLEKKQTQSE